MAGRQAGSPAASPAITEINFGRVELISDHPEPAPIGNQIMPDSENAGALPLDLVASHLL